MSKSWIESMAFREGIGAAIRYARRYPKGDSRYEHDLAIEWAQLGARKELHFAEKHGEGVPKELKETVNIFSGAEVDEMLHDLRARIQCLRELHQAMDDEFNGTRRLPKNCR